MRERRKSKGYTQAKLAKKAGVSRQYISEIENSKSVPSVGLAKRIAEVLDCSWKDFF